MKTQYRAHARTAQSANNTALNILTRRDHSEAELRQKLKQREFDTEAIEQAIAHCYHYGYLNDARYAELFVRAHVNKGHGAYRIAQEMQQKGLDKELIQIYLHQADYDWFELAAQRLANKFKAPAVDLKEKQKQQRYLIGQGFSFEQVKYAQEMLSKIE